MSDDHNVINLFDRKDPKVKELFEIGTTIDSMVIDAVGRGFDLFEISAIIGHRLGECIRNLPNPEHQGDVIIEIVLKRAGLSNV